MEVMEDGNLMDKIQILIQRDMEYYKAKQTILQETICPGIVGGRLDFPRYVSFASMKLVLWWEDEFVAAYRRGSGFMEHVDETSTDDEAFGGCGGIVKASDPKKFITLITKSAEQFLDHLHVLTQEALDHADLTVLTGTIGAAALLKNCLWCYNKTCNDKNNIVDQLQKAHKKYREMGEALAERLLDLHCRLLSLYILQDPESLDWENNKPFFESERGSYIIQMWWLYMQGTKQDLWNTVPPKMAQRVFAGMLNESLTILSVRYTQVCPSMARTKLLAVDISNLLFCVSQLLPSVSANAEELIGLSFTPQKKIIRDIHAKCQELLICLILRCSPFDTLYKVFRKGIENLEIRKTKVKGPSPWVLLAFSNHFSHIPQKITTLSGTAGNLELFLELIVLMSQPQPNWSLLLKVLCMSNCTLLRLILKHAVENNLQKENNVNQANTVPNTKCGSFLCLGDDSCKTIETNLFYHLINSTTYIILSLGNSLDFSETLLKSIEIDANWAQCFDKRQIWNQIRPAWYETIIQMVRPILPPIVKTVVSAVKTGASMYQAMSIVLGCYSQLCECIHQSVPQIAYLIQDLLPGSIMPIGKSVLLHILNAALYSELITKSDTIKKELRFVEATPAKETTSRKNSISHKNSISSFDGTINTPEAITLAIAEALCSIDEDNKHTEEINEILNQSSELLREINDANEGCRRVEQNIHTCEVLASDLLETNEGKKSLKLIYIFMKNNIEWIFEKLLSNEDNSNNIPNQILLTPNTLLHTMFHIGNQPFDQYLTGKWEPDWFTLLSVPMGLSVERIWSQIQLRWEFRDVNSSNLSTQQSQLVSNLITMLKP